ncbi:MAG: class I SAM-dependent methyltransferase [Candidatus Stahlbacteria bacterium]|nr:class I SAM-dependent methyltransferase [Candidatus Stahlbacteria bacterium]
MREKYYREEKNFHEFKFAEERGFELNPIWRKHSACIMKHVRQSIPDNPRILNLGSGPGYTEYFMRNDKVSIFSLDISFNALKNIKKQNPNNIVINANASDLPFKAGIFNSIIALNILHHIPDFKQCILEVIRVSKPTTNFISLDPWATKLRFVLRNIFRKRWSTSHSPYEKDLTLDDLSFLKRCKNIVGIKIEPFNPFIPLFKLKLPWVLLVLFVPLDMLCEKLGIGWLHFISFKIKRECGKDEHNIA